MIADFEKLGVFYLGKSVKTDANASDSLLLYESKDLLTHGVCIGMTGSGKTGLCLGLIEEAAIDSIPVIAIDPKGDLSNLLLTFPNLAPADFKPWVSAEEAQREQISVDQLAEKTANVWKEGIKSWGQDGDRIAKFKNACDISIYTPGSTAGLPVSILTSLKAPPDDVIEDGDLMRERVVNVVNSLLTLLGLPLDPLKSREHILLSTIVDRAWRANKDIELNDLISQVQEPTSGRKIGALDIDSFFPKKERFEFALSLNNLLAAPGFEAWLTGYPLDIDAMLFTASGKPKISIFSIAHLNDTERMFFVTLLLNQILAWVRTQPGSSSLRAILYMDEIYGYFPPVANPPSKVPLLTLLKQARAYGLGILLASQNSVDLDYKGLANAGTWFVGRLQTERDKQRLLDGLEGAAGENGQSIDKRNLAEMLGRLKNRVFLMNNVHEDRPVLFETRWTLSYLFGPLVRSQIKTLMADRPKRPEEVVGVDNHLAAAAAASGATSTTVPAMASPAAYTATGDNSLSKTPPIMANLDVKTYLPLSKAPSPGAKVVYRLVIFAACQMRFIDAKSKLDTTSAKGFVLPVTDTLPYVSFDDATFVPLRFDQLSNKGVENSFFAMPSPAFAKESNQKNWRKDASQWLAAHQKTYLLKSAVNNEYSKPGETEKDFRLRLCQAATEARDAAVAKLKEKYGPKFRALEQKKRAAQADIEDAQIAQKDHQTTAVVMGAATVLEAVFSRKVTSVRNMNKVRSVATEARKAQSKTQSIERLQQNMADLAVQEQELDQSFRADLQSVQSKFNPANETFEIAAISPKTTNISLQIFAPVWAPYEENKQNQFVSLWF